MCRPAKSRARIGLGDCDTAIAWLERAHRAKAHSPAFLAVDPRMAPLADLPWYVDLLRRMNLDRPYSEGAGVDGGAPHGDR